MLIDEAKIIKDLLGTEENKRILNICSSDETFWKVKQPFIWKKVMQPLLERNNSIINLDMKKSNGVDIIADCTDMQCIKDDSYDIALFTSGVEHIVEVDKALLEIRRILKPGGFMICSAPGIYPEHHDPIDTMLRLPSLEDWKFFLKDSWQISDFLKSSPVPARPDYNFKELVFATVIKTYPVK